jgi:hypothetical protein
MGTVAIGSGTVVLDTLLQGSGAITIGDQGLLNLAAAGAPSGTISGTGTVALSGAPSLTLSAALALSVGQVLEETSVQIAKGVTITNAAGRNWTMQAASGVTEGLGGAGTFSNQGVFATAGGGIDNVGVAFINAGSVLANTGSLAFLGAFANTGTVTVAAGAALSVSNTVTGAGTLAIADTAALTLVNGSVAAQKVNFLATDGDLTLVNALGFTGTISGFGGLDQIDLAGASATGLTVNTGTASTRVLVQNGASTIAVLKFAGSFAATDFALGTDNHGGSLITHT